MVEHIYLYIHNYLSDIMYMTTIDIHLNRVVISMPFFYDPHCPYSDIYIYKDELFTFTCYSMFSYFSPFYLIKLSFSFSFSKQNTEYTVYKSTMLHFFF